MRELILSLVEENIDARRGWNCWDIALLVCIELELLDVTDDVADISTAEKIAHCVLLEHTLYFDFPL